MRPAIFSLALVLAACSQQAPAPAPVEPPPAPEPEPQPVAAEPVVEPAVADCVDLTFTEGAEGNYTIPAAEGEEHQHEGAEGEHAEAHAAHVKHHFQMPEGKDALLVDVTWSDPAWAFDVATGIGGCPHNGKSYASVEGSGSAHLFVPASAIGEEVATFVADEGWFVHLAGKGEHEAGSFVTYTVAAKACVAVKVEAEAAPEPTHVAPPVVKPGAPRAIDRGPKGIKGGKVIKGDKKQ